MKKDCSLQTAGKTSGILGIKFLFVIICISSTVSAELLGKLEDELDEPQFETTFTEKLAALDTSFLTQQPITSREIQLSASEFELHIPKSSFLAVGLSSFIPGLGHVYLGDMKTAGVLAGSTGVGLGLGFGFSSSLHSKEFIRSTSFLAVETTWLYGIYAAYRDVRTYNKQAGYCYKMPIDSFSDLTSAPFNFRVLKKPEVWGGLLGSLAIAFGAAYLVYPGVNHIHPSLSLKRTLSPFTAFPIGIGEESFFRGFLQSQLSEWFTPWGGIILSSLIFGVLHMPNAWDLEPQDRRSYYTAIVPLITVSGIYDGWLTYKNHSLKESVAIHAWYDFILFTIGSVAGQTLTKGRSEFAIAVPF
jgi:membrane protease YdiL (CAAX protease family)